MNLTKTSFAASGFLACAFVGAGGLATNAPKPKKHIPTFSADVAPILYGKCATCHHQGEVAPFSLMSYADAKSKASTIANAAKQKFMPPWQASTHGEFKAERTLTADQIATLSAWAAAGAPAGDLAKAPKAPVFTLGWKMGQPDFIGEPAKAYPVDAEGADDYRCFVIPTHYSEDRYVTGIEVRPGNHKIVHHVLLYVDSTGTARKKQSTDGKPGYAAFGGPGFAPTGSLGGWAPGLEPQILHPGTGFLLPKGADVVLQLHYHKDGKPETDLTKVGLKFSDKPVDKKVRWQAIGDELLEIPANQSAYEVKASLKVPRDVTVLDVIPHMHWLGHDMKVTATLPDGTKKQLIDVDRYDFNWQTRYSYKAPVHIPAGTTLSLVAHYDNSASNPRNPNNPPKEVTFGEQTSDEMCFAFFSFTVDQEHLSKGVTVKDAEDFGDGPAQFERIFNRFDADHDGYLDQAELSALIKFFDHGKVGPDGKPENADQSAKFVIAMFGKSVKGKMSKAEFVKMVTQKG